MKRNWKEGLAALFLRLWPWLFCGGVEGGRFGVGGLLALGFLFDGAHDAEEVAAVDLLDVVGGVAFFEQGAGEGGELVVGAEVGGNAVYAVEVGADADMVDASDLDGV